MAELEYTPEGDPVIVDLTMHDMQVLDLSLSYMADTDKSYDGNALVTAENREARNNLHEIVMQIRRDSC